MHSNFLCYISMSVNFSINDTCLIIFLFEMCILSITGNIQKILQCSKMFKQSQIWHLKKSSDNKFSFHAVAVKNKKHIGKKNMYLIILISVHSHGVELDEEIHFFIYQIRQTACYMMWCFAGEIHSSCSCAAEKMTCIFNLNCT